jgi:hypothetical protein
VKDTGELTKRADLEERHTGLEKLNKEFAGRHN